MGNKRLTGKQQASVFMLCKMGLKQKHVAALVGCSLASVKRLWPVQRKTVEQRGRAVNVWK